MKIALIGHGAMGKLIERLAVEKGHVIGPVVDDSHAELAAEQLSAQLRGCDVVIDFTVPEAVRRNIEACVAAGVPIVEGTTGWNEQREEIETLVRDNDATMVFGANFSIGVNLFYKISDFAAELFSRFPEYEAFIEEQHHSRKKDAPSGTALKIKETVERHVDVESVTSTRSGNIPGTHRVGFDGPADQILLEHTARSREGFALGAIMAAEWIVGKKGSYEFSEVMGEMVDRPESY